MNWQIVQKKKLLRFIEFKTVRLKGVLKWKLRPVTLISPINHRIINRNSVNSKLVVVRISNLIYESKIFVTKLEYIIHH